MTTLLIQGIIAVKLINNVKINSETFQGYALKTRVFIDVIKVKKSCLK